MPSRREPGSSPRKTTSNGARRTGEAAVRVYETLRRRILEGKLAAGTHLSQQALCQQMNTSNGPVISALRRLAYEGLVSYERSTGCRVTEFSSERFADL